MKVNPTLDKWRQRAEALEAETYALYLAYRDSRTPWYARLFSLLVVLYALSPVDLVPDFIPVLGYVDDLLLVPVGVWIALKMIPAEVMADSRLRAREIFAQGQPRLRGAVVVVILTWLFVIALVVWWVLEVFSR